jgi:hypothetical protein
MIKILIYKISFIAKLASYYNEKILVTNMYIIIGRESL